VNGSLILVEGGANQRLGNGLVMLANVIQFAEEQKLNVYFPAFERNSAEVFSVGGGKILKSSVELMPNMSISFIDQVIRRGARSVEATFEEELGVGHGGYPQQLFHKFSIIPGALAVILMRGRRHWDEPEALSVLSDHRYNVLVSPYPFATKTHLQHEAGTLLFQQELELTTMMRNVFSEHRARHGGRPLVGVHVRQGDYRRWADGVHYHSPEEYRALCEKLELELGCDLIIVSDEDVGGAFADTNYSFKVGTAGLDFAKLMACDAVVGPPSTFSGQAVECAAHSLGHRSMQFVLQPGMKRVDSTIGEMASFLRSRLS
jgi:hypothetical protein